MTKKTITIEMTNKTMTVEMICGNNKTQDDRINIKNVLIINKIMKIYIKGFYGYKNFGDEIIFFGLLNFLQKEYNPESFVVEVGNKRWMQSRTQQNKVFLDSGILDKLDFVENAVVSRRFRQLQIFLGLGKYRKHFKAFGGGEVLDESRKFPHDGWNLMILYRHDLMKKNFILLGGIGSDKKKYSKKLFKYMLQKSQKIVCREKISYDRCQKYQAKSILLYQDFSKEVLEKAKKHLDIKKQKIVLINTSPKHMNDKNIEKIEKFLLKYPDHKKIFFPADINFDKEYYPQLRQSIDKLEIYDWTKHSLSETVSLFLSADAGVGSRLHFLYPLKLFQKDFVSISQSDKIKKML